MLSLENATQYALTSFSIFFHILPCRDSASSGRDVFNEPPSKEDLALAAEASAVIQRAKLGSEAVLHTSRGDIHVKLLPEVRFMAPFPCCRAAAGDEMMHWPSVMAQSSCGEKRLSSKNSRPILTTMKLLSPLSVRS